MGDSWNFLQCCAARNGSDREVKREISETNQQSKTAAGNSPLSDSRRGLTKPTTVPPGLLAGAKDAPANLGGVGIIFRAESRKEGEFGLIVASLALDGPADKSGQVMVGDELVMIDNIDIQNTSAEFLAPLILGPPGSKVVLGLRRKDAGLRTVELTRGWTLKRTEQWSNPLPANHALPDGMSRQA